MNKLFTPGGPYPSWDRDWGDGICEPFKTSMYVAAQVPSPEGGFLPGMLWLQK